MVFFEVFDAGVEIGGAFFVAFDGEGAAEVGVFEAGALSFEVGELCLVFVLFGGWYGFGLAGLKLWLE